MMKLSTPVADRKFVTRIKVTVLIQFCFSMHNHPFAAAAAGVGVVFPCSDISNTFLQLSFSCIYLLSPRGASRNTQQQFHCTLSSA
jgi:hypothetical protein